VTDKGWLSVISEIDAVVPAQAGTPLLFDKLEEKAGFLPAQGRRLHFFNGSNDPVSVMIKNRNLSTT
jgi:hypothetical protein